MRTLPTGTVTFLFTDIEGSTARWQRYGDGMRRAVGRHDEIVRAAIERHRGYVFKTGGDSFCAVFAAAPDGLAAALAAQRDLAAEDFAYVDGVRVRMALHSGQAEERNRDYFGLATNRVARLLDLAHGSQMLLSGVVAELCSDELPPEVRLYDLGEHRLRDLDTIERVFQLQVADLPSDFPPLRSLDAQPNNLPAQLTRFVGRAQEVADLTTALEQTRLLTLVGAGGVGKTRLALRVAEESLRHFRDGVWQIDLAAIADPALVASQAATVLGTTVSGTRPVVASLVSDLASKTALLIFDCCEHVLDAVAKLVEEILRACPRITILATSRQALELEGETVHVVGTFDVPPAGVTSAAQASSYSAVQLFADRARAASGFELTDQNAATIASICRRVDGIALAIELAAPRVALLTPQQIDERLGERFKFLTRGKRTALPRQQTLRALFDWSFDLLDETERSLFRRLGAFSSGWDLKALNAVCAVEDDDAFDQLASLVAKSLVVAEPAGDTGRYRLLDSTREYARELLLRSDDAEQTMRRHARHYHNHVADALPLVESMDDDRWRSVVGLELDNIRSALDFSLERESDRRLGLEILGELERWRLIMTPHEALQWYERGAALARVANETSVTPKILRQYYTALWFTGGPADLRAAIARETLEAARAGSDPLEIVHALWRLGHSQTAQGEYVAADESFRRAWKLLGNTPHRFIRASMLSDWAHVDLKREDNSTARSHMAEAVKLVAPGSMMHAHALVMLGELEFIAGHLHAAKLAASEAHDTFAAHDSQVNAMLAASNLAAYAMAANELDDARVALADALRTLQQSGTNIYEGGVIEKHALYAALTQDLERAMLMLGYSSAQLTQLGQVRAGSDDRSYNQLYALLRGRYSELEIAEKLSAGAKLSEQEVLAHATAMHNAYQPLQDSTPVTERGSQ